MFSLVNCCGPMTNVPPSMPDMGFGDGPGGADSRRNSESLPPDVLERNLHVGLARRGDISNRINRVGGVSGVRSPEDRLSMFFAMVDQGQAELLDLFLMKHGKDFDLNQIDSSGDSALHIAARRGKIQVVKMLLKHGALRRANREGRTPEEEAREHHNTFIATLLETTSVVSASAAMAKPTDQHSLRTNWPHSPSQRVVDAAAPIAGNPAYSASGASSATFTSPTEGTLSRLPNGSGDKILTPIHTPGFLRGPGSPGSGLTYPAHAEAPAPSVPPPRSAPPRPNTSAGQPRPRTPLRPPLCRRRWWRTAGWADRLALAPEAGAPAGAALLPSGQKRSAGALGEIAAVALHTYTPTGEKPFPDDPRPELGLVRGDRFFVVSLSPDGWALVRRPNSALEGWAPGNFLSADGQVRAAAPPRHSANAP